MQDFTTHKLEMINRLRQKFDVLILKRENGGVKLGVGMVGGLQPYFFGDNTCIKLLAI